MEGKGDHRLRLTEGKVAKGRGFQLDSISTEESTLFMQSLFIAFLIHGNHVPHLSRVHALLESKWSDAVRFARRDKKPAERGLSDNIGLQLSSCLRDFSTISLCDGWRTGEIHVAEINNRGPRRRCHGVGESIKCVGGCGLVHIR